MLLALLALLPELLLDLLRLLQVLHLLVQADPRPLLEHLRQFQLG
jgi:hypothetical protein